ncbi:MAG TPA: DUF2127 domain-containing protein [Acidobacteriaceae bacterium]|jgi:uncharacterized membrane protein (DUF2068 family)|nr:DUF2127 domain-containing protein [Acidobacteriaceae bacterium]
MKTSKSGLIRLIAVFKLLKTAVLIVAGAGILKMMHNNAATVLEHGFAMLGLDPGNRYVDHALRKVASLPPERFKELSLGSFVYAALFLTEGVGLWMMKRWAEWFTIAITGSLIPLEIYEICRHPTAVRILVLILNAAIVVYLLVRIRRDRSQRTE